MSRAFEWQAAAGGLHAIRDTADMTHPPLPGDEIHTLCGVDATLTREDWRRRVLRPTCSDCLTAWCRHDDAAAKAGAR